MPDAVPVSAFRIKKFQGFDDLCLPKLSRINIIGGLNSSGKSALLEALFMFFDRRSVASVSCSSTLRQIPFVFERALPLLFYAGDTNSEILWELERNDELTRLSMKLIPGQIALQQLKIQEPLRQAATRNVQAQLCAVLTYFSQSSRETNIIFGQGSQLNGQAENSGEAVPSCTFFGPTTRYNHVQNSEWYSRAVQDGHKKQLLLVAQAVYPAVSDLDLIQTAGMSLINAATEGGKLRPLPNLGDGTYLAVVLAAAIIGNQNGILLIDEFDGAIHFSKMQAVWGALIQLCTEFNCQIFAATHSRDSIEGALKAHDALNRLPDLTYVRLDRIKGLIRPETYSGSELKSAVLEHWEVR